MKRTSQEFTVKFNVEFDDDKQLSEIQSELDALLRDKCMNRPTKSIMEINQIEVKDAGCIAIVWGVDDITGQAEGKGFIIPQAQAIEILDWMERKHDATLGINWDTIDCFIDMYLDNLKDADYDKMIIELERRLQAILDDPETVNQGVIDRFNETLADVKILYRNEEPDGDLETEIYDSMNLQETEGWTARGAYEELSTRLINTDTE